MKSLTSRTQHRRAFLRFLAGSPYIAALGGIRAFAQQAPEIADVITDPKGAFSVMDFEEAARRKVLPGHWAYMVSGVDDDATVRANRDGYKHVQLRPRRLRDATKVDIRTELFGTTYNSPVFTCPTGRREVLSSGWRTRRSAGHQSARDHADAFHQHIHRRGGRERRAR